MSIGGTLYPYKERLVADLFSKILIELKRTAPIFTMCNQQSNFCL